MDGVQAAIYGQKVTKNGLNPCSSLLHNVRGCLPSVNILQQLPCICDLENWTSQSSFDTARIDTSKNVYLFEIVDIQLAFHSQICVADDITAAEAAVCGYGSEYDIHAQHHPCFLRGTNQEGSRCT